MAERTIWKDSRKAAAEMRARNRSPTLAAPYLATSDTMDPIRSMADGKMYTSKAILRQSYRDQGVEEVGTEKMNFGPAKRAPDHQGVRDAIDRAKADIANGRTVSNT